MKELSKNVKADLEEWQYAIQRKPYFSQKVVAGLQRRVNNLIPEKVHGIVTKAIKEITRGVLLGAKYTTRKPLLGATFEDREKQVRERINLYTSAAAGEGAITGFGGFVSGLADFPLWLSIKMKMLFEIASKYGYDTKDYKERLFLLHIFQLAFSSQKRRNEVYQIILHWDDQLSELPQEINDFDWKTFQLEYRDNIDLAKLLQLIPGFGAVVGAVVNHRLTNRLGKTAMNAYRLRYLKSNDSMSE